MGEYNEILVKINQFIKKYYLNELLRGVILFLGFGLFYFLFTLLIEYFFWLPPFFRSILFWVFIGVEVVLFYKYIFISVAKLIGYTKTMGPKEAAVIIGKHFPEIQDKLLNMLQLSELNVQSELIHATIKQKSNALKPFRFPLAIDFKKNLKHFKWVTLPVAFVFIVFASGYGNLFSNTFDRVVHYNQVYQVPAPFQFVLQNKSLTVIEGQDFSFRVKTKGNVVPEYINIVIDKNTYVLEKQGFNEFSYTTSNNFNSINFYFESNGFKSKMYKLTVVKVPQIKNLSLVINFPTYLKKPTQTVKNTGNVLIPEGSTITWKIETFNTKYVEFVEQSLERTKFSAIRKNLFQFKRKVVNDLRYKLNTSNTNLSDFESFEYAIQVKKDEFPFISVESDIDSVLYNNPQFIGIATDDYSITKVNFVYYNVADPKKLNTIAIPVQFGNVCNFYYKINENVFEGGKEYKLYFEAFDNDGVNGKKSSKSKEFSFRVKTLEEISEIRDNAVKEQMYEIHKTVKSDIEAQKEIEKIQKDWIESKTSEWERKQKLNEIINEIEKAKQKRIEEIDRLQENVKQVDPKERADTQEELNKRLEELKNSEKNDFLLQEIKKFQDKISKEELFDKLDEFSKKNKSKQQNLERLLELTKRFYIEQKLNDLGEKIVDLGIEQKDLGSKSTETLNQNKQKGINEQFSKMHIDFKEISKINSELLRPLKLNNSSSEFNEISKQLIDLFQSISNERIETIKKEQNVIGRNMEKLGKSLLKESNEVEGDRVEENIEDLRMVLENVIEFSFNQESILHAINAGKSNKNGMSNLFNEQKILKQYFEHIDDSLYVLSLRIVKMTNVIRDKINLVHYNMDKAINNLGEDKVELALVNQQFVITYSNDLGVLLSSLLDNLMNSSPKFGKGKGNNSEFSLPDIIKKQGDLKNALQEQLNKKEGNEGTKKSGEDGEGETSEVYELYKKQEFLKEQLNQLFNSYNLNEGEVKEISKSIEELQEELIQRGISREAARKIEKIEQQFLQLESALKNKGVKQERESTNSYDGFKVDKIKELQFKKRYFNSYEILNRQSLPLQTDYKKKVIEYFNNNTQ